MVINHAELLGVKIENQVQLMEEDTLIQILVYLPAKSLLRFMCASKYWCTLIKSPAFVTRHFKCPYKETILVKRFSPPETSTEICEDGDNVISFHNPDSLEILVSPNLPIPILNDPVLHRYVGIFGPCNGLICLAWDDITILCNPALREFKLLDPSPFACPDCYAYGVEGSGFGFDANTNVYKIIRICNLVEIFADGDELHDYYREEDTYYRIDLYNSSTNSWCVIDAEVPVIGHDPGFDIFFNGAMHWQTFSMGTILTFDVSTEVFKQFEYPNPVGDEMRPALIVLNQCLALVRYVDWTCEPHIIDIWIMKEYGVKESWTKELVIGPYHFSRPCLVWKNEWLVVDADNQLASCALHARQTNKFQFHGLEGSLRALIFTESLISLN